MPQHSLQARPESAATHSPATLPHPTSLRPLQEVYERILESPDYVMIRTADDPCHCGSGEKTSQCHDHNPDGILFRWSKAHADGESCRSCPTCIGLPATTQLLKVGNLC